MRKYKAIMPIDWQISEDTVVQPDVSVLCEKISGNRIYTAPKAIFEILSESTARKDKTTKFDLYRENKVGYYIIVDPQKKQCEVYLFKDNKYELQDCGDNYEFDFEGCRVNFFFKEIFEGLS
jgi:Uma2 family endonuclease